MNLINHVLTIVQLNYQKLKWIENVKTLIQLLQFYSNINVTDQVFIKRDFDAKIKCKKFNLLKLFWNRKILYKKFNNSKKKQLKCVLLLNLHI